MMVMMVMMMMVVTDQATKRGLLSVLYLAFLLPSWG